MQIHRIIYLVMYVVELYIPSDELYHHQNIFLPYFYNIYFIVLISFLYFFFLPQIGKHDLIFPNLDKIYIFISQHLNKGYIHFLEVIAFK